MNKGLITQVPKASISEWCTGMAEPLAETPHILFSQSAPTPPPPPSSFSESNTRLTMAGARAGRGRLAQGQYHCQGRALGQGVILEEQKKGEVGEQNHHEPHD